VATEPLQSMPYPQGTSATNVPADIQALAVALAPKLNMVFASAATRTAAFTAAGIAPAAGMLSYRADATAPNWWEYYNTTAAAWRVHGQWVQNNTLVASAASVTFTGIPSYLKTVTVRSTARSDVAATNTSAILRFNADATNSYRHIGRFVQNNAAWDTGPAQVNQTSAFAGYIPGNSAAAGVFGVNETVIAGWDNPHANCLTHTFRGGFLDNTTNLFDIGVGNYIGSGPYTSITVLPAAGNFMIGSEFQIIGVE
jgi:hypothetical protein